MARTIKPSAFKGKYSFANFFLLKNRKTTLNQLKIRLTVKNQTVKGATKQIADCPITYNGELVKVATNYFNKDTNRLTGGFENNDLLNLNMYLNELGTKAVNIGDKIYLEKGVIKDTLFKVLLYSNAPILPNKKQEDQKPPAYIAKFYDEENDQEIEYPVSKDQLDNFQAMIDSGLMHVPKNEKIINRYEGSVLVDSKTETEYENSAFESREDFDEQLIDSINPLADMPTAEYFEKGYFDHDNIFHVFISARYPHYKLKGSPNNYVTNKKYSAMVWRLLQYKHDRNPPSKLKDFNVKWCKDFLKYIFEEGFVDSNFKGVDPLRIDPSIWNKPKLFYDRDNYYDVVKWVKGLINSLIKTDIELLPEIRLKDITLSDFIAQYEIKKIDRTPQDEQTLKKPELDKLFHFEFKDERDSLTRDRFILIVAFGGLRINEFNPTNLEVDDDGFGYKIAKYTSSKNKILKEIHNPLNEYSIPILEKHNYIIPFLGTGKVNKTEENQFNTDLKRMAVACGFLKRKVKDKVRDANNKTLRVKTNTPIEKLITSSFARHTISDLLKSHGMSKQELGYFTGHTGRKDTQDSYLDKMFKDVEEKRRLLIKHEVKPF